MGRADAARRWKREREGRRIRGESRTKVCSGTYFPVQRVPYAGKEMHVCT